MGPSLRTERAPIVVVARSTSKRHLAAHTEDVARLIDALVTAVQARRIHGGDPMDYLDALAAFERSVRYCVEQIGDLRIGVEESDLLFMEHCVYHDDRAETSLACLMFHDGVRELVLRRRVRGEELASLVEILASSLEDRRHSVDDVVTLLWEQALQNITLDCAPPVDDWETEVGPSPAGSEDPFRDAAPADPACDADQEAERFDADGSVDDWQAVPAEDIPERAVPSPGLQLSAVEIENIHMIATIEGARSLSEQVADIVEAILASETEPESYLESATILIRLAEEAAVAGDLQGANRLLERLRRASAAKTTPPGPFEAIAQQAIRAMGSGEFLAGLRPIFEGRRAADLDALSTFLGQLGPGSAPALCDYLGEVGDAKIRRSICSALVVSCKESVDVLIGRLSDKRWFLVRNILYVLGEIAHQGVERALGDALYHPDVRVRREAVRALGEVDSPTSRAYLNSGLRDSEKSIRVQIAHLLARKQDERVARVVWNVIESPEFEARDDEERRAFFEALGRSGSDALVPRLEEMLTRSAARGPGRRDSRGDAALALAWLGTPRALAVLGREVTSRHADVRLAVLGALEAVKAGGARGRSSK